MKTILIIFLLSVYFLLNIILVVAFLTLLERKVLASIHKRKGPNVVGLWGLLQPIADAVKLLFKENPIPQNASSVLFFLGPSVLLVLSLSAWFVIPFNDTVIIADLNIGMLYVFMISSLNALNIIIAGWSSNSRYAFLGALRSIAQVIAYEVIIGIVIINVLVFSGSLNLLQVVWAQKYWWFAFSLWFQFILFFIAMLAETNRHPFDLAEAESELVSGYNVEHGSILFAVFFLAEYANIILLSHIMVILFLGGWSLPDFFLFLKVLFNYAFDESFYIEITPFLNYFSNISWLVNSIIYNFKVFLILFCFIWVRASLPRYRYDQLMRLGWKVFVPLTIALFFLSIFLLWFFSGYAPAGGVILI